MATVTAPEPRLQPSPDARDLGDRLADLRVRAAAVPTWAWAGGGLILLMALTAYMRSRFIGNQLWMDEAITTGIATHPLLKIPGIMRVDGNPPLYYMLLHIWIGFFGDSEAGTHSLSLLAGVLTVPFGGWGAWKMFGRRAGVMAALMFAFNAWLTAYAQETRMYELVALEGTIATTFYVLAFVQRKRRYLAPFGVLLVAMLYTHSWGTFFFFGSVIALVPALLASDDRKLFLRDVILVYLLAGICFLPWAPTLLFQAAHTAAPWDVPPRFGLPIQISRNVLGGDRISIVLVFVACIGLGSIATKRYRRTREATMLWTLLLLTFCTLAIAWIGSQITPAWNPRYFAPVVASLLFLICWGCSRARVLGWAAILLAVWYLHDPSGYAPQTKSDMRELAANISPSLAPGDIVISGQPEQTPLSWYYFPGGLRFTNTANHGAILADPRYMNWVDALSKIKSTNPTTSVAKVVGDLRRGQKLLFIRPLTEGQNGWKAPWTYYIRLRSAQWGAALQADVSKGLLTPVRVAPSQYREACCVADSAVLYRKN